MLASKFEKHRSWFYSAAIALLIGGWLLSGQFGEDDEAAQEQSSRRDAGDGSNARDKVRVRTMDAEEITRTIVINGKTAPARTVELSAETEGRIIEIGARRGDNVDTGTVIVRLDERDRRARLAQTRAMVKQREVEYEARSRLKAESYVSEAQLQEALASLEAAKAELRRAELDLQYMVVRAPFDGALQSRVGEIGDFVKVGEPVATVVDNRSIIVSADISEFDAAFVEPGQGARARLATGESVSGIIRYVSPVADEATRTFAVELEVDNENGKLRAGGTAEMIIPAEKVMAHRVSPSLLTLDDAGNLGIKIINQQGEVEFVAADIAHSTSDGVWLAGLPDTATVITVGHGFVTAGTSVEAIPELETAAAGKRRAESN